MSNNMNNPDVIHVINGKLGSLSYQRKRLKKKASTLKGQLTKVRNGYLDKDHSLLEKELNVVNNKLTNLLIKKNKLYEQKHNIENFDIFSEVNNTVYSNFFNYYNTFKFVNFLDFFR